MQRPEKTIQLFLQPGAVEVASRLQTGRSKTPHAKLVALLGVIGFSFAAGAMMMSSVQRDQAPATPVAQSAETPRTATNVMGVPMRSSAVPVQAPAVQASLPTPPAAPRLMPTTAPSGPHADAKEISGRLAHVFPEYGRLLLQAAREGAERNHVIERPLDRATLIVSLSKERQLRHPDTGQQATCRIIAAHIFDRELQALAPLSTERVTFSSSGIGLVCPGEADAAPRVVVDPLKSDKADAKWLDAISAVDQRSGALMRRGAFDIREAARELAADMQQNAGPRPR